MRIEPASLDDVERVADMWVALAEEQRHHDSHLRARENREPIALTMSRHAVDGELFVARDDDEVIGFVSFEVESGRFRRSVDRGIVQNVYVEPAARDEGVGTALLDAAEAELRDRGVDVISIETMAENEAARRMYRRRGYSPYRIEYERHAESDTHSKEDG